jgi:hypothetical protein
MIFTTWIHKLFKSKRHITKLLYKQAAYHESGHIVMAYLSGYKCDEVSLIINEPGMGRSKFDYGDPRITMLIASMQNYIQYLDFYAGLENNIKAVSAQVAFKSCGILMGGPVSESLNKFGINFKGNLPIEMSGPDLVSVSNIDAFLNNTTQNHNKKYIPDNLYNVILMIRQKETWQAITHLSNSILSSPNKKLTKKQIEKSLRESGYLDFIR